MIHAPSGAAGNPPPLAPLANPIPPAAGGSTGSAKYDFASGSKQPPHAVSTFVTKHVVPNAGRRMRRNDAHFHPTNYVQKGHRLEALIEMMDRLNIKRSVVMPIPTSIISLLNDPEFRGDTVEGEGDDLRKGKGKGKAKETGRPLEPEWNHHCGPMYYLLPQYKDATKLTQEMTAECADQMELWVDSEVDCGFAAQYAALSEKNKARLNVMMTGLHLGSTFVDVALFKKILNHPDVYSGIGEITLSKEIVQYLFAGKGQANLSDRIEPFVQLVCAAAIMGSPLTLHCDMGSAYKDELAPDGTPLNYHLAKLLLSHPKIAAMEPKPILIWAHLLGVNRFGELTEEHMRLKTEIMEEFPWLHCDNSWSRVAVHTIRNEGVKKAVVAFMEKFSHRIAGGSDALDPQTDATWAETDDLYSGENSIYPQLSKAALDNILVNTYERTIGVGKANIAKFAQHVLPLIKPLLYDSTVTALNMKAIQELRDAVYANLDADAEPEKQWVEKESAFVKGDGSAADLFEKLTDVTQGLIDPSSDQSRSGETAAMASSSEHPGVSSLVRYSHAQIEELVRAVATAEDVPAAAQPPAATAENVPAAAQPPAATAENVPAAPQPPAAPPKDRRHKIAKHFLNSITGGRYYESYRTGGPGDPKAPGGNAPGTNAAS
jgi:hypothetical protein